MRYCYLFLVLLLAAGCNKKSEPEPYIPAWDKPAGVLGVEAQGVPKENIRFSKLSEDDLDRIVITLPQNYPANAPIKLKFHLAEGFSLAGHSSSSIDLADYNGKSRTISVMNSEQVYCESLIDEVLFYGFVDVLGHTMAVDLKSTATYTAHRFAEDHQNLYLPALCKRSVNTLRYIITDFSDVYTEEYSLDSDFSLQYRQIKAFTDFLETRRERITDRRIFVC